MLSSLWGCFQIYQPMPGSISASETVADLWSSLTDTPNLQYECPSLTIIFHRD